MKTTVEIELSEPMIAQLIDAAEQLQISAADLLPVVAKAGTAQAIRQLPGLVSKAMERVR